MFGRLKRLFCTKTEPAHPAETIEERSLPVRMRGQKSARVICISQQWLQCRRRFRSANVTAPPQLHERICVTFPIGYGKRGLNTVDVTYSTMGSSSASPRVNESRSCVAS